MGKDELNLLLCAESCCRRTDPLDMWVPDPGRKGTPFIREKAAIFSSLAADRSTSDH